MKKYLIVLLWGAGIMLLPSFILKEADTNPLPAPTLNFKAQKLIDGLQAPVDMAFIGNNEFLVAEQAGKIRLVKNGKLVDAPVLDITNKLVKLMPVDVRGLLGFALHPKFKTNHKIYVFYSAPKSADNSDHQDVIAEYTLAADWSTIGPENGRILFTTDEPGQGDNGGCLRFGPDGYLYIGMGDGGGGGDKHGPIGNGQNLNTLLGKILRIDVNSGSPYGIPKDNPFVGKSGARPEIWAYGLRNPWRFSFDNKTDQLTVSDVGEGTWEEIDVIEKGGNYGWRMIEGNHCFNPKEGCDFNGTVKPIAEYDHRRGVCVIGGYIYNGKQLTNQKGKYFFADWTGPIYYIEKKDKEWQQGKVALQNYPQNLKITSWSQDQQGELYLITNGANLLSEVKGAIYKIVSDSSSIQKHCD